MDGVDAGQPIRGELEEIRQAGERAADLTRQLLAFGRQQMLQPRVVDLNQELVGLEAMLRRLLGEHIDLVVRTCPGDARVFVDPSQLGQVVMNLAVNARDAMLSGGTLRIETSITDVGPAVRIDPSGGPVGAHVLLAVSDTGVGMDAGTREHIFEPFFTTKEQGKGTGLGLSTVFGIVKQSHGHITVESEPGRGSTFRIFFPRTEQGAEGAEASRPGAPASRLQGSETILLVEDAEPVRRLTHTILRRAGYQVLEAENGVDALRVSAAYEGKNRPPSHRRDDAEDGRQGARDAARPAATRDPGAVRLGLRRRVDRPGWSARRGRRAPAEADATGGPPADDPRAPRCAGLGGLASPRPPDAGGASCACRRC